MLTGAAIDVWMPGDLLRDCMEEARRTWPQESGGVFMGWWSDPSVAVVTAMIGPGPLASHGVHHFEPDQQWQIAQIADHYAASGRRETYLGDWHSHPHADGGSLSWRDRAVLRRIAQAASARCNTPLMAVLWGASKDLSMRIWQARLERRRLLWDRLVVSAATLRLHAGRAASGTKPE